MMVVVSRLFLFLLLVADWAGDPYFGHSPLSRPLASQDAVCPAYRADLAKAITLIQSRLPIPQASSCTLALLNASLSQRTAKVDHLLLSMTDPLYASMSLQC
jgi:hypothetical protein